MTTAMMTTEETPHPDSLDACEAKLDQLTSVELFTLAQLVIWEMLDGRIQPNDPAIHVLDTLLSKEHLCNSTRQVLASHNDAKQQEFLDNLYRLWQVIPQYMMCLQGRQAINKSMFEFIFYQFKPFFKGDFKDMEGWIKKSCYC